MSPAASSAAEGATVVKWFLGSGGLRSRLGSWAAPQGQGEATGGVGWAKEWLAATYCTGVWRRPNWPELGKRASPGQSTARRGLGEQSEVA